MDKERVFFRLFGRKLLSYRIASDGSIVDTGLLNPLFNRLRLFLMLYLQAGFYRKYRDLGR